MSFISVPFVKRKAKASHLNPVNSSAPPPPARSFPMEIAPARLGEKSRGGVGVSNLPPTSGVAIYSDGPSEKKSTASGGEVKNPFRNPLHCYHCKARVNRSSLSLWQAGLAPQRCQECGYLQPPYTPEARA